MTGMREMSDEERLKAQIAHTREELGETVEALAAKANVPARVKRRSAELTHEAQAKVAELSHDAQVKAKETTPAVWIAGGGVLAALVALLVWLKVRS